MQTQCNMTQTLPDKGQCFHEQRTAASQNPPVFLDLFYRSPGEDIEGLKTKQVPGHLNFF